jgi:light-regulated signal transduction histidine kinase (bacteriophytochrome)
MQGTADQTARFDNEQCAREPIRIPGSIQPHGALLLLDPATLTIIQRSANAPDLLGLTRDGEDFGTIADVPGLDSGFADGLKEWTRGEEPLFLRTATLGGRHLQIVGHRGAQGIIVEFEEAARGDTQTLDALYPRLRAFVDSIEQIESITALSVAAAAEVRDLTGFDRVMIYRFEPDWNGVVIAEQGNGRLPSYLDLRFPASDIPAQARELYHTNRLRLIPDANFTPIPLEPAICPTDGAPLDMSFAGLRSVSPVHLDYMRNMDTAASMSISIVIDGALWGLISCHHREPWRVAPHVRIACDFLGRILALQIAAKERMADAAQRITLKQIETRLLAELAREPNFTTGLVHHADLWMKLAGAGGAAVVAEAELLTVGDTPSPEQIHKLVQWLEKQSAEDFFVTDHLALLLPEAETYGAVASGVAAARISQIHPSYILWFRPETVRTVAWGGDPHAKVTDPAGRLHPRRSFSQWQELVRLRAVPWSRAETQTLQEFRAAIVNFVLRRAEERASLTDELQRSNKELEAFSYSVSHDLRAPFRHIVGYAELLNEREKTLDDKSRHYLDNIIDAAISAGRLVDDLLTFSQIGRASLTKTNVDIEKLIREVRRSLDYDLKDRAIDWRIGRLPNAWADGAMLRQALLNLIGNAVKYSRDRKPAIITIEGETTPRETIYTITDNGVGFDMAYVGKLFGVFQRLHRVEEFEGTGIGLALTRRIIERHEGWIEAQGELDAGARFRFALPRHQKEKSIARS